MRLVGAVPSGVTAVARSQFGIVTKPSVHSSRSITYRLTVKQSVAVARMAYVVQYVHVHSTSLGPGTLAWRSGSHLARSAKPDLLAAPQQGVRLRTGEVDDPGQTQPVVLMWSGKSSVR